MTDIPSWARAGARVVLVDASNGKAEYGTHDAVKGDVCILTAVGIIQGAPVCQCRQVYGRWALDREYWAELDRFRPAVEPKTEQEDTAMFKRLVEAATPTERLDRLRELLDV